MRKTIFLLLLLLAFGGLALGIYQYYKPHQNMQRATADFSIPATQLMADFNQDENAANLKYLDKVIAVNGTVREATTTGGVTTLSLEAGDDFGAIACELDRQQFHRRTDFAAGETLTIKGLCTGKTIDVVLVQCVVAE